MTKCTASLEPSDVSLQSNKDLKIWGDNFFGHPVEFSFFYPDMVEPLYSTMKPIYTFLTNSCPSQFQPIKWSSLLFTQ